LACTERCTIQNTAGELSDKCGSLAIIAWPVALLPAETIQLFEPRESRSPKTRSSFACASSQPRTSSINPGASVTFAAIGLLGEAPLFPPNDIVWLVSLGKPGSVVVGSSAAQRIVSRMKPARAFKSGSIDVSVNTERTLSR